MAAKGTYRVIYEHDGSTWFARIASLAGCHTQGRTLAQARQRIREALGLFDDNAETATLVDDVRRTTTRERKKGARATKRNAEMTTRDVVAFGLCEAHEWATQAMLDGEGPDDVASLVQAIALIAHVWTRGSTVDDATRQVWKRVKAALSPGLQERVAADFELFEYACEQRWPPERILQVVAGLDEAGGYPFMALLNSEKKRDTALSTIKMALERARKRGGGEGIQSAFITLIGLSEKSGGGRAYGYGDTAKKNVEGAIAEARPSRRQTRVRQVAERKVMRALGVALQRAARPLPGKRSG